MKKINLKEVFHSRKKALILLAFVAIIVGVLIFNWLYFEEMLSENRTANNRQEEVVKIAQQMQETSDNLAYLVRNYVFTGDIQYFEDYWSMELHGEGREDVVKKLRSYHFDNEEHKNLNIILDRCDELKKQEVYAMWLALAQYHVHAIDYADEELQGYIRYVENYDKLPMHEDRNEPVMGQKQDAIDYLSGEEYSYCTQQLFNAIDEFVSQEQNKLDNIAQQNRSISNRAILFQGMCIILVIVCIALIFLQNHKMYSLRSLNANIVSAVSEEYRLIALVNLKTHQVTCLKDSRGDWEKDVNTAELGEIFDKYMNNQVAVAYQEQYIRTVQPQNIIRKFDEGQAVVSCLYKNNADEWIMLDITKSQEYSKQNPIVVFTYKNAGEIIQQQKEQRQRDEMLMYFSRDFFEVYVVDLKQGSYEIIRSAERYGNYIKNLTGDFVQLMELAIVSWTKPPYRDMFRQLIDMEDIKKQFDTGTKKIEFIYESYDEKWKSLQCFPVPEYGPGNEKMIFALQDYTEEMQIRTNEVLASEAMNSIYTLVAFRDYEANRYECIHSADKFLSELPDKGNYDDLRQYILSIIHDDDREKYLSEISDEKFNCEGRAECEFRLKDKDGEYHYYHEYITRVEVPSGSRMVILVKNIDESKMHEIYKAEQLQKEIRTKEKELEMTKLLAKKSKDLEKALKQAKSANDAKSRFLSNMSHDLRTPMNAILGMTYLAKKHVTDETKVNKCLDTILSSSENMLALINDVLDMNKIESGVIELHEKPGSLRKLIDDVEVIFRNKCEANQQELMIRYDELRYPNVKMDELRMKQILMNLLSNAVKYTQSFGKVSMQVSQDEPDSNQICCTRFTIMDNGIGMSEEFVKKVFQPFEREDTILSDKVEGTGLGMAIVKNLVDIMKGTIEVDSMVNVGTKVIVTLPLEVATQTQEVTVQEKNTMQYTYPGKHILIVEDKRINMEIVKGFLEDTELIIDEARNGKEALEKVEASREGTYDLIFMDIRMPVMKGDEATMKIRALDREDCKRVPIIAMTANALESDVENSYQCGMNGHISKPIEPDEVYRCLNKWLMGDSKIEQ